MNCENCGKEISSEAYRCPECGEPTQKYKEYAENPNKGKGKKALKNIFLTLVCLIVLAGLGVGGYFLYDNYFGYTPYPYIEEPTEPTTLSAAEIERNEFYEAKAKAIAAIKDQMKDPESLQINNCWWKNTPPDAENPPEYVDLTCKFVIKFDITGRNGFGGATRNDVYALCYDSGYVKVYFEDNTNMSALRAKLTYLSYSYVEK